LKKVLILIIVIAIFSCKNKEKIKFYYPSENYYKNIENPVELELDNFSNFEKLIDSIGILMADKKNVVSQINEKNKYYYFEINSLEEKGRTIPYHIKLRNLLGISTDSILKNDYYSTDSLSSFLKKDLLNFGKDRDFSDNPNRLIVSIELEKNQRVLEVKKILLEVFKTYDKLDKVKRDTIPLNIYFNWKSIKVRRPPIPTENEMDE